MNSEQIYPWQQTVWQHVTQRYQQGQLPHALLLSGSAGLGKLHFAQQLALALMCDLNKQVTAEGAFAVPCGQCNGCHLMNAGTHPDFRSVQPEADGKQISIDSIREVSRFLTLKSQFAPLQVVIVAPAEAMNHHAANSLLKTLEEPTPGSLLLLVTNRPDRLLPTIRSRCQLIEFSTPEPALALNWLEARLADSEKPYTATRADMERLLALAYGAPVLALQFAQNGVLESYQQLLQSFEKLAKKQLDPVAEAKQWESVGLAQSVKWLYLWVATLIGFKSGREEVDITVKWREPVLASMEHQLNYNQLYAYLDKVTEITRMIDTPVNVQLTLEDLLTGWQQLHS